MCTYRTGPQSESGHPTDAMGSRRLLDRGECGRAGLFGGRISRASQDTFTREVYSLLQRSPKK